MKKINIKGFMRRLFPIKTLGKLTHRLPKTLGKIIRGFVYFSFSSFYLFLLLTIVVGIPEMIYECNTYPDSSRPNISLYTIKQEERARAYNILNDIEAEVVAQKHVIDDNASKYKEEAQETAKKKIQEIQDKAKQEIESLNKKADQDKTSAQTKLDEVKGKTNNAIELAKAEQEKAEAEKKAEEERIEAEKKVQQAKVEAIAKAETERIEAEKKVEAERIEATRKAEAEKSEIVRQAAKDEKQSYSNNSTASMPGNSSNSGNTSTIERNSTGEGDVYVAAHGKGVYHGRLNCFRMKNATKISLAEAKRRGLRPCQVKGCN